MFLREAMLEKVKEAYKKAKSLGIVISILMFILGLVMFFVPAGAAVLAMWLMVVGLLLHGIMEISVYCKMPEEARDGWTLASGIIWVIIALLLIYGGLSASAAAKLVAWGNFEMFIAFMVGFTSIFNGIKVLCTSGAVKAMGGSTLGCILSGILGILVGIIVLSYPIGSVISLTVFYGLFLTIGGIALFLRSLTF